MTRRAGIPATLYHGTTERIAKQAPVFGLSAATGPIYLTDVYPGYFAFYASTKEDDRWGILEIDLALLEQGLFVPSEWLLEQTVGRPAKSESARTKRLDSFRKNLDRYHRKWKESLRSIGSCAYLGPVPKKAIRRVTIYDPHSNPMITTAVISTRLTLAEHKQNYARHRAVTRWLLGEDVTPQEWAGVKQELTTADKEKLAESLQSKWGLDVFFFSPPPKPA